MNNVINHEDTKGTKKISYRTVFFVRLRDLRVFVVKRVDSEAT